MKWVNALLDVYGGLDYVFVVSKNSRYFSLQNHFLLGVLKKDVLKNFSLKHLRWSHF